VSLQLVTRVHESLVERVDALVAAGVLESRSEAVRLGLERLADQLERRRVGERIVEGYTRLPQTDEELDRLDAATERMIAEEPW
jgi:Arc/MetJ-type ribon-helix-helix transcriptional regulator